MVYGVNNEILRQDVLNICTSYIVLLIGKVLVKCTKKRAGFEQKSAARDNMDDKAGVLYEDKCNVQDKAEAQARRIAGGKFFILVHARPCRQAQGLCPI